MTRTVTALAPAKLNLALSVGPPDDDGLHPISSWMVTVDLHDELTVARLDEDRFSRYAVLWHEDARRPSDIDWPITRDLAVRAHLALEQHVGRRLPVQMKLAKRIPVGGGLGGGSSDAAAMLRAINTLFDLDLEPDELASIGAGLGSDIPFLVHGGSALVEGLGERVERHAAPGDVHAVLIFPDAACATGAVYGAHDDRGGTGLRPDDVRALADAGHAGAAPWDTLFNDLHDAAVASTPGLGGHVTELTTLAERPALVSGSGSTVFVVCDDPLHAAALAEAAQDRLGLPAVAVTTIAADALAPQPVTST